MLHIKDGEFSGADSGLNYTMSAFIQTMVLGSAWGVSSAYSADDPEYGAYDDDREQNVKQ